MRRAREHNPTSVDIEFIFTHHTSTHRIPYVNPSFCTLGLVTNLTIQNINLAVTHDIKIRPLIKQLNHRPIGIHDLDRRGVPHVLPHNG